MVARRVVAKLERTAANPDRFFSRLVGADESKLRVGDYRILAVLDHRTRTNLVSSVEHWSRVYDRRR